MGQSKSDEEIQQIAGLLKSADLIAIQEVVAKHPGGAQSIGRLAEALDRMGAKWDYRISHPTASPSSHISERYAFLWKSASLDLIGKASLDTLLQSVCYREPYVASFRDKRSGTEFVVVNFHSRRFDEKPEEEVRHLAACPARFDKPVIIAGDFNLPESHPVFRPLLARGYTPALINQPTTLKRECQAGRYLNHAIDNIFLPSDF